METIPFTCPHCNSRLNVPRKLEGKRGPCPKCRKAIRIKPNAETNQIREPSEDDLALDLLSAPMEPLTPIQLQDLISSILKAYQQSPISRDDLASYETRKLMQYADWQAVQTLMRLLANHWIDEMELFNHRVVLPLVAILKEQNDERVVTAAAVGLKFAESAPAAAAAFLMRYGGELAINALVESLSTQGKMCRENAVKVLQQMSWSPRNPAERAAFAVATNKYNEAAAHGSVAIGPLINALDDTGFRRPLEIAEALIKIGDPSAAAQIMEVLEAEMDKPRTELSWDHLCALAIAVLRLRDD